MRNNSKKARAGQTKNLPEAKQKTVPQRSGKSAALSDRLLHELQVHQIELEAQNQELREAHQLLEESRNRYADLYDLAPVGYVTLNHKGLIQEINLPGAALLGIERARLIGLPFSLYVATVDKPVFRAHLRHCQQEPGPCTTEVRLTPKDGRPLDVELHTVPIPNAGRKNTSYLIALTDITERRRLEESLRESEILFRTVFDRAGVGMVLADRAGRLRQTNPAFQEMLGYSATELNTMAWTALLHSEDVRIDGNLYAELIAGKRDSYQIEKRYVRKDGQLIWGSTTVSLVRDRRGEPDLAISLIENITDYKRAEQEINQLNRALEKHAIELGMANQELDSFSYSVSHDLRAPLASIDQISKAMLQDYGAQLPIDGQSLLNLIHENALAMSRLIEDLLAFSRTSRQPLKKETVSTPELVRHVMANLRSAQADRQIEIIVGELPPCQADPALLAQVWLNLLSNALKFTSKCYETRIEIGSFNRQNETVYFVKDNGVGFDMEYAGRLFKVFQRLHGEEDYPGTGVGLAIVERIVRRHGGRIWAEGVVGQGASFYFTLA